MSGDIGYYGVANGGKYAGGTTNASSFGASRNPNQYGAAQLSAFRNRFYDQRTGRWTQEDPIGVAGGLNLYGYVGNNPVAYTDPFGLCPPVDDDPCNLNTGDSNLDNLKIRQPLETNVKSAPGDTDNPGLRKEVGGWCTGGGSCTKKVGDIYSVAIGQSTRGAALAYHAHPNEGKPLTNEDAALAAAGQRHNIFRGVSDPDRTNATARRVSTYIFAPNTIIRLTPNGKGGVDETTFARWTTP